VAQYRLSAITTPVHIFAVKGVEEILPRNKKELLVNLKAPPEFLDVRI